MYHRVFGSNIVYVKQNCVIITSLYIYGITVTNNSINIIGEISKMFIVFVLFYRVIHLKIK